jgi:hypothetical protein
MVRNFPRCAVRAVLTFLALQGPMIAFAEETEIACQDRLSKKARTIYDAVVEKRQGNSDLNELWKEVTRDLITSNAIGREEATSAAKQALTCLE